MAVTTKPYGDSDAEVKKGRGEGREWVSVGIRARGGSDSGGKGTPFVLSGKPTEGEAGVVGHKYKGVVLSTSPHKARQDESGSSKGGAICVWTRSLYEGCGVGEGEFQAQDKKGEGLLALQG